MHDPADALDPALLRKLEATAVEAATLAGRHITAAFATPVAVEWKRPATADQPPGSPVTAIDRQVEASVRDLIEQRFPDHGIFGEELTERDRAGDALVWAIDPVDGTSNFVHRHPLVAASIGVLHHGVPVAGAIWCSATHLLTPGVFHAHRGGTLHFGGEPVPPDPRQLPSRLVAAPGGAPRPHRHDMRAVGSAATECAFVAAGVLAAARIGRVHVWDVAAGVLLVQSAGGRTMTRAGEEWVDLRDFEVEGDRSALALPRWHQPLLLAGAGVDDDELPRERR